MVSTRIEDSLCAGCELLEIGTNGEFTCSKDLSLLGSIFPLFPEQCMSFIPRGTGKGEDMTEIAYGNHGKVNDDQQEASASLSQMRDYILRRELLHLRKVRIGVPPHVMASKDLDQTSDMSDWEDEDDDSQPQVARIFPPKRRCPSWTIEDRRLFSPREIEMEGYCEECQNFGVLTFSDGLYRCSICLNSC
jgi:hypothetical protein